MNIVGVTPAISLFILAILGQDGASGSVIMGYAPGISGMPSIDATSCLNDEIIANGYLANPLECARTCKTGESRTCYYKFVIERYPVNGKACQFCMPNITNTLCPNCQCVPGDGTQRTALTVNRMLPGPSIQVCVGDYVVVDVANHLKSDTVTIHWHGLSQQGTPYYDGVPLLTQCPILVHNEFRYQFFAYNVGTHIWHAHTASQKMDGIFGSLIVREPEEQDPHSHLYDFDLASHVVVINDWFNEESTTRFPGRIAGETRHAADKFLINGKGRYVDTTGSTADVPFEVIRVDANQRYRFRLINSFCTVCAGQLTIEDHNLTVIAIDGQSIKPVTVNSIVSLAGERYDFVINTNKKPGAYWIQLHGLDECQNNRVQQLAILQYQDASVTLKTKEPTYENPLDPGITLNLAANDCSPSSAQICLQEIKHALAVDPGILKERPDVKLDFAIGMLKYTEKEFFTPNTYKNFLVASTNFTVIETLNNISSVSPSVPALTQLEEIPEGQFCNSDNLPEDCRSGVCSCTHLVKIPLHSIVEINLVDEFYTEAVRHPFHLHGFTFHVMGMGQPLGPTTDEGPKMTMEYFKELERNNLIEKNTDYPLGKDTIVIPNNGYTVIRFRASNPGLWLFHCHQIFHEIAGMEVILQVGEVSDVPKAPKDFPKCGDYKPKIGEVKESRTDIPWWY